MTLAVRFHNALEQVNPLLKPTEAIAAFFKNNPTWLKVALIVNHLFRAAAMLFMMIALPFCPLINFAICFAGSLFYRLTVETNCAYKFALPAFLGSMTFPLACSATVKCISGAAFASINAFASTLSSFIPITAYLTYILLTVSYDVDKNCPAPLKPLSHCSSCH